MAHNNSVCTETTATVRLCNPGLRRNIVFVHRDKINFVLSWEKVKATAEANNSVNIRIRLFILFWCKLWFCSLARKRWPRDNQATTGWEMPNTICTNDFSLCHLQLSIRVCNHCGQDQENYKLGVSLRSRFEGRNDGVNVPDNDVTPSESSSPNKLHYIMRKIWNPQDCVYNNTITAQAWHMTYHRPQPADYLSNNRQRCKQATFTNNGLVIPFTMCLTCWSLFTPDLPSAGCHSL